jgi:adenylate kinase family enzyme
VATLCPTMRCSAVVAAAMVVAAKVGGYVRDGFPRTVAQAECAYKLEPPAGFVVDAAIFLAMPDELARRRLAGRALQGRSDDADAVVVERQLAVYHDLTSPLLAFYAERGLRRSASRSSPRSRTRITDRTGGRPRFGAATTIRLLIAISLRVR